MDKVMQATDTASATAQLGDILELFEGVATHADSRKDYLPALNAVRIYSEGGHLFAAATDRYRLISGRIEADSILDLEKGLVPLADIKRITALLKGEGKKMDTLPVTFSRVANLLTVSVRGNSITIELLEGTFPPIGYLIKDEFEVQALDTVTINPAFMADYAKIAGKGEPVSVTFTGAGKPLRISIAGHRVSWRALLMPMRDKR
jgi:hypothetical protein